LQQHNEQLEELGLRTVVVLTGSKERCLDTLSPYGFPFLMLHDSNEDNTEGESVSAYGVELFPTSFLMGPDRVIIKRWEGWTVEHLQFLLEQLGEE